MATPDNDIRDLLKADRKKALTILFTENYEEMCRSANRIVRDPATAEDIVQEIFLKFYDNRREIAVKSSLKGYLKRIAVNAAIDHYRKNHKNIAVDIDNAPEVAATDRTDAATGAAELEASIREAIDELPTHCRLVFLLKRKEGLSNKEIAEKLSISVKTVENQTTKAMKLLREKLKTFLSWGLLVGISRSLEQIFVTIFC